MSDSTPAEQFERDLKRTVDRLAAIPLTHLERVDDDGLTLAVRTWRLAQAWAGPNLDVPRLRTHATADQLAVVGREFRSTATDDQLESARCDLRELRQLSQPRP